MEITSDIQLKGKFWDIAINDLKHIFNKRTNYDIFILSLSIGILYDETLEISKDENEFIKYVPRNIITNYDNGKLDFYFQAAILTTTKVDFTEDERMNLAFGMKEIETIKNFKKIDFLVKFANYGVKKLTDLIGDTKLETVHNIKEFMETILNNTNDDLKNIKNKDLDDELIELL